MISEQKNQNIDVLFYRFGITYFEASKELIKNLKKQAFHRLSLSNQTEQLGYMMEGVRPVALGEKIFISDAIINFSNRVDRPELAIKLKYYENNEEKVFAIGALNIQNVNHNFFSFTRRYNSQQICILESEYGELKLIYSLFTEVSKSLLEGYIKKFKENERDVMRAKRSISKRKKEKEAAKIQEEQRLVSVELFTSIKQGERFVNQARNRGYSRKDSNSQTGKQKSLSKPIQSVSAKNYLEVSSALKIKRLDKNINKLKDMLSDKQQKSKSDYSSQMESYTSYRQQIQNANHSTLSDGSEYSQMIANKSKQTYSQRVVVQFKKKVSRCINILLIIMAISLLYLLIAPTAKFQKQAIPTKKNRKSSKTARNIHNK